MTELDGVSHNLAENLRRLRETRGYSQARASEIAEIPRPTWASLESGAANPTLNVLTRVAGALQVSVEELIGSPHAAVRFVAASELKGRKRAGGELRRLIPDAIAGIGLSRLVLEPGGTLTGVPHTTGTREYLACEAGRLTLHAAGQSFSLGPGDCVVFRGDQRHSYRNESRDEEARAISVISFATG